MKKVRVVFNVCGVNIKSASSCILGGTDGTGGRGPDGHGGSSDLGVRRPDAPGADCTSGRYSDPAFSGGPDGRVRPDLGGHGRPVRNGGSGGPGSSGGLNGPGIPGGRVWPAGRESPNGFGRSLGVLVVMVVLLAQVAVEAQVILVDTLVLPALMARLVSTV